MGRIGLPELVLVLVIVLLIFGAGKLPEIGSAMGKAIREFKRTSSGADEEAAAGAKTRRRRAKVEPQALPVESGNHQVKSKAGIKPSEK